MTKSSSSTPTTDYPKLQGFYTPHDPNLGAYDGTETDPITGEVTRLPSMTRQSEMAACDINNIIKDFQLTGQVQHINRQAQSGMYADLTTMPDFQEALHIVQRAEEAFASLPAKVRSELGNDPAQFLAYIADPANKERLYEWGLATRPETPPVAAPAADPPPAAPDSA